MLCSRRSLSLRESVIRIQLYISLNASRKRTRTYSASTNFVPQSGEANPIKNLPLSVTTYRQSLIPTQTSVLQRIPLSIVDIHLRKEQLPFAYFFDETLDENKLEESLKVVVQDFPQLGGRICSSHLAIICQPNDTVPLSFGQINTTLQEWQSQNHKHIHQSWIDNGKGDSASPAMYQPVLLPLFDALFDSQDDNHLDDSSLAKIRVTYFEGEGTAIGVNFCHVLGDTSSCVHFVQSWGKQMRQKEYKVIGCIDRSKASVSGMMTADIADIMGLATIPASSVLTPWFRTYLMSCSSLFPDKVQSWWAAHEAASSSLIVLDSFEDIDNESIDKSIAHEYVRLEFTPGLLMKLKEMGTAFCLEENRNNPTDQCPFISSNDMITAFGWLMKRNLSQNASHNISMVVNLRGRSGVNQTMFGNGIAHVVATLPDTIDHLLDSTCDIASSTALTKTLCQAGKSIREALQVRMVDLTNDLYMSQIGRPVPSPNNSTQSFSTTSWGQFPLYKIRFGNDPIVGFHGHPVYPLPVGKTYSSVITPSSTGGYLYEMLLPSNQVNHAKTMHANMTNICMAWTPSQTSTC